MGCLGSLCHLLFISSALLTGLVSYYLYQAVPDNIDNPWVVRAWLGARQLIQHVTLIEEKLGIDDRLVASRKIYTAVDRYRLQHEPPMPELKVSSTILAESGARIYEPKNREKNGPAILYFHGGGWTSGSIDSVNILCRELASRSGIMVISISFSLAPEDAFPQALDDGENATRVFMDTAKHYGVDPKRVALAGDDTGANLAAALALRSRDRAWPQPPKLQVLFYPILQLFDFNTPSYVQNKRLLLPVNNPVQIAKNALFYMKQNPNHAHDLLLNKHTTKEARQQYETLISHELLAEKFRKDYQPWRNQDFDPELARTLSTFVLHPHVSPLMYGNGKLHRIAKAYIATMEHDVVRDDGLIYARRLRQSGGKAVLRHYDNGYHDCLRLLGFTTLADTVLNDAVEFMQKDL